LKQTADYRLQTTEQDKEDFRLQAKKPL